MMNSRIIRWVIVAVALVASTWLTKRAAFPMNDSVEYWSAARLALGRQNPYDAGSLLSQEQQAGSERRTPLEMWNPPWVLPFILPLAFFSYAVAQKLWLFLGCAYVALSIYLLWRLYGRTTFPSPMVCLTIAVFTPMLVVLAIGQIGPLMLLGISAFLWFESRQQYVLAGFSLSLVAVKPHLVFLLWIALVLWAVQKKRRRIVLSFLAPAIVVSGIVTALAPHSFMQYRDLWRRNLVRWDEFPTVSGILSHFTGNHGITPVLMPAALACIWLLHRWTRIHGHWKWTDQLPVLLLVSLATSPYGWFFDGVILLPALIQMVQCPSPKRSRAVLFGAYIATNCAVVLLIVSGKTLFWYSWITPAWLLLYIWASLHARQDADT